MPRGIIKAFHRMQTPRGNDVRSRLSRETTSIGRRELRTTGGITLGAADEQIGQKEGAGNNSYRSSAAKVLVRLAADPWALDGHRAIVLCLGSVLARVTSITFVPEPRTIELCSG